jgi:pimeloyl-ACP methyl ester carboxylesterase
MGEFMRGEPLRPGDWAGVTVPTLVLAGGKSEPLLRKAARAIADVLPNAEHRELPKPSHNPNVRLLAPAAAEFLTGNHTGTP